MLAYTFYERDGQARIQEVGRAILEDSGRWSIDTPVKDILDKTTMDDGHIFNPSMKEDWDLIPRMFRGIMLWVMKDMPAGIEEMRISTDGRAVSL